MAKKQENSEKLEGLKMADSFDSKVKENVIANRISTNLAKLMAALNWSQTEMAAKTGISTPCMSNYLKGTNGRIPSLPYLINLCSLEEIKKEGLVITIDNLLSNSFDPARSKKEMQSGSTATEAVFDHSDITGSYLCYFYDQAREQRSGTKQPIRPLRYGLITLFDDYNGATGEEKTKAYAAFYKEEDYKKAIELKSKLDELFCDYESGSITLIRRNDGIKDMLDALSESKDIGIYEGETAYSANHTFINIFSRAYNDHAQIILYAPPKKSDKQYLGGAGCVASLSHGYAHMPVAQKIILSRNELKCSNEEIAEHLNMTSVKASHTDDVKAIAEMCKSLYSGNNFASSLLDEGDKEAVLERRLVQLTDNYISKNLCCVVSVSEDEDRAVYDLIRRYSR